MLTLLAHVVELLPRVVHQVHRRTGVLPPDVVCFHKVAALDRAAVAHSNGPILDGIDEGSPNTFLPTGFSQRDTSEDDMAWRRSSLYDADSPS